MRAAILFLLASAIALAYSQTPGRCKTPPAWSGYIIRSDPSKSVEVRGKYDYDSLNERVSLLEEVFVGREKDYYHEIALYKEKVFYRANYGTKTCTKETLTDTFRPIEIPANATMDTTLYIGTSAAAGAGVEVVVWSGNFTTSRGQLARYVIVVTDIGCVPINDLYYDPTVGGVQTSFFDIKEGVDPNDFVPPDFC